MVQHSYRDARMHLITEQVPVVTTTDPPTDQRTYALMEMRECIEKEKYEIERNMRLREI